MLEQADARERFILEKCLAPPEQRKTVRAVIDAFAKEHLSAQ